MKSFILVLVLLGLVLQGCAQYTLTSATEFYIHNVNGTDHFFFRMASGCSDQSGECGLTTGEAKRIEYLERWLKLSSFCKNGYEIDEKRPILTKGLLADVYLVDYYGRCK